MATGFLWDRPYQLIGDAKEERPSARLKVGLCIASRRRLST
jgi:hypothetical protein